MPRFHFCVLLLSCLLVPFMASGQWSQTSRSINDSVITGITSDAIDVYASSRSHGILRSDDFGQTWFHSDSGLASVHITCLASNLQNLFAGTEGSGVFVSGDQGQTWLPFNSGLQDTIIRVLCMIDAAIYAGTDSGGIYKYSGVGDQWTNRTIPSCAGHITDLIKSPDFIFASTTSGIFRTRNDGLTWDSCNSGLQTRMVLCLSNIGSIIFAGTQYGGIFVSQDQGSSWTAVNHGLTSYYISQLCQSDSNVFAATHGSGFFWSGDLGGTWKEANEGYYEGNINILSVIPPYIFAAMDTSGIWKRKLSDFSASSVPAFTANQSFSIFPDNLSPGHIIIQSDLDAPFTGNIELFSISGCKIFSHSCKMLQHSRNEIQLPQVSPGLYFLTLSGDHLTLTYKLSLR